MEVGGVNKGKMGYVGGRGMWGLARLTRTLPVTFLFNRIQISISLVVSTDGCFIQILYVSRIFLRLMNTAHNNPLPYSNCCWNEAECTTEGKNSILNITETSDLLRPWAR